MKRTVIFFLLSLTAWVAHSCSAEPPYGDAGSVKYGCIAVTGTVVGYSSDAGQLPLEGMEVKVDYDSGETRTVYTGQSGEYAAEFYTEDYADNRVINVTVSDADGMDNGFYATASKDINHNSTSGFAGGDGANFVGTKTYVLDFLLDMSGR